MLFMTTMRKVQKMSESLLIPSFFFPQCDSTFTHSCKTKDNTNDKPTDSIEARKTEIPDCSCESAKK